MRRLRWIFVLLPALFLISSGWGLIRFFRFPERVQEDLLASAEERMGIRLFFEDPRLGLDPFPFLSVGVFRLESLKENPLRLSAKEAQFHFRLLPLLIGQIQISGLQIHGGEGMWRDFPLKGLELEVRGLAPSRWAPFEAKAENEKGENLLEIKGNLTFQKGGALLWNDLGFQAEGKIDAFPLARAFPEGNPSPLPFLEPTTLLSGGFKLNKNRGVDEIGAGGPFQLENLTLTEGGTSSVMGETEFLWNPRTQALEFRKVSLKFPFGDFEGKGRFDFETGQLTETRGLGRNVVLEELVSYFPKLFSLLPLDTGFSGPSELDFSLGGTWDYLTLNAHWDFTPAVLTYGKIFSKPKDFPLSLRFDFLLKEGSDLSGDVSFQLGKAAGKGALVSMDLKTGKGEWTLLTNKFSLEEWPLLLTPLAGYRASGEAKLLLNSKGNLTQLDKAQHMINLTLEEASFLSPEGKGLEEVSLRFDLSPLGVHLQNAVFKLGDSLFQGEIEIYNFPENPRGKVEWISPRLDPLALGEHLGALQGLVADIPLMKGWQEAERVLQNVLPKDFLWEEFRLHLLVEPKKMKLEKLEFRFLEGGVSLRGSLDQGSEKPQWQAELQIDRLRLASYFEGREKAPPVLQGNLFLNGVFQATGETKQEILNSLTGEGTLSLTNGEWLGFDLLTPLMSHTPFKDLHPYRASSLPFYDLKTDWRYRESRFEAGNLFIHTEDFWIEGKGTLSLAGVFNARLEVSLSRFLTERLLDSWKAAPSPEGQQLGPLPFLWVGNLSEPELKIDERSFAPFLEDLQRRRYRRILHRPFQDEEG